MSHVRRRGLVSGVVIALLASGGIARAQSSPDVAASPPEAGQDVPPVEPQVPAPTRATFLSTTSDPWDVTIDGVPTCATPCVLPLFPLQFVGLRSQEQRPVLLDVGRLPPGDLIVRGKPLQNGMYAGGIVATTLGGMAMVVAITLTAVGHARDRDGMTTAGLITGGAGAILIPAGIYLMVRAVPAVSVDGASPYGPGSAVGIAGSF
jgi:hypothetical protein